jgi:hypothetical protein
MLWLALLFGAGAIRREADTVTGTVGAGGASLGAAMVTRMDASQEAPGTASLEKGNNTDSLYEDVPAIYAESLDEDAFVELQMQKEVCGWESGTDPTQKYPTETLDSVKQDLKHLRLELGLLPPGAITIRAVCTLLPVDICRDEKYAPCAVVNDSPEYMTGDAGGQLEAEHRKQSDLLMEKRQTWISEEKAQSETIKLEKAKYVKLLAEKDVIKVEYLRIKQELADLESQIETEIAGYLEEKRINDGKMADLGILIGKLEEDKGALAEKLEDDANADPCVTGALGTPKPFASCAEGVERSETSDQMNDIQAEYGEVYTTAKADIGAALRKALGELGRIHSAVVELVASRQADHTALVDRNAFLDESIAAARTRIAEETQRLEGLFEKKSMDLSAKDDELKQSQAEITRLLSLYHGKAQEHVDEAISAEKIMEKKLEDSIVLMFHTEFKELPDEAVDAAYHLVSRMVQKRNNAAGPGQNAAHGHRLDTNDWKKMREYLKDMQAVVTGLVNGVLRENNVASEELDSSELGTVNGAAISKGDLNFHANPAVEVCYYPKDDEAAPAAFNPDECWKQIIEKAKPDIETTEWRASIKKLAAPVKAEKEMLKEGIRGGVEGRSQAPKVAQCILDESHVECEGPEDLTRQIIEAGKTPSLDTCEEGGCGFGVPDAVGDLPRDLVARPGVAMGDLYARSTTQVESAEDQATEIQQAREKCECDRFPDLTYEPDLSGRPPLMQQCWDAMHNTAFIPREQRVPENLAPGYAEAHGADQRKEFAFKATRHEFCQGHIPTA